MSIAIRFFQKKIEGNTMKKVFITSLAGLILFCSFQVKPAAGGGLKASMDRGKKVYGATCIACHQPDGLGVQRMNPPLAQTKWVLGDKKALAKIVLGGLKGGEIEIDGDDFHNPMPPLAGALTDVQIADVLTYVRNSFGNKASAVTAAEVSVARKQVAGATAKPAAKPVPKKPLTATQPTPKKKQ
jgi:mono/diheme cytochrome c family protein